MFEGCTGYRLADRILTGRIGGDLFSTTNHALNGPFLIPLHFHNRASKKQSGCVQDPMGRVTELFRTNRFANQTKRLFGLRIRNLIPYTGTYTARSHEVRAEAWNDGRDSGVTFRQNAWFAQRGVRSRVQHNIPLLSSTRNSREGLTQAATSGNTAVCAEQISRRTPLRIVPVRKQQSIAFHELHS